MILKDCFLLLLIQFLYKKSTASDLKCYSCFKTSLIATERCQVKRCTTTDTLKPICQLFIDGENWSAFCSDLSKCKNYSVNNLHTPKRKQMCCDKNLCNNPNNYINDLEEINTNLSSVFVEKNEIRSTGSDYDGNSPRKCNSLLYWSHYNFLKTSTNENPMCCSIYLDITRRKTLRHVYGESSLSCDWAYFSVNNFGKLIQDYCYNDFCNTLDYAQNLSNLKCEKNYSLEKLKLRFKFKTKYKKTKKCFYCENCHNPNEATIIDCNPYNLDIQFACQHSYYYENSVKIWNFNCVRRSQYAFISYKTFKNKQISCYGDLCNSYSKLKNLENLILCEKGFYTFKT